jgi:hypothetical protein
LWALGPLPGDRQVFAFADSLDVFGDDFLVNALPASRSLSEVGAELGSPLLERAQLGPEASIAS